MAQPEALPSRRDLQIGAGPEDLAPIERLDAAAAKPRLGTLLRHHAPPLHGAVGLGFIAVAWPLSWLQVSPLHEYAFILLWLGYVLTIDAWVVVRKGTSLLTRSPAAFGGLFVVAVPLWWSFEGINQFTQNWRYVGSEDYSTLRYVLVASWHFSVVIPAVFETAELLGSCSLFDRLRRGPAIPVSRLGLAVAVFLGLFSLGAVMLWPSYAFPCAWLFFVLTLDPVNYLAGRPSVTGQLAQGDWRLLAALALAALVCGWFWEMWNFWAFPKWEYDISFVDFARVFEMPLLGYIGYLPFGLEVFAAYHFIAGLSGNRSRDYVQILRPGPSRV